MFLPGHSMAHSTMQHALHVALLFAFALCNAQAIDSDDEFYQNSESRGDESPAPLSSKTVTVKVGNIQI
jgi:hypothetical protein